MTYSRFSTIKQSLIGSLLACAAFSTWAVTDVAPLICDKDGGIAICGQSMWPAVQTDKDLESDWIVSLSRGANFKKLKSMNAILEVDMLTEHTKEKWLKDDLAYFLKNNPQGTRQRLDLPLKTKDGKVVEAYKYILNATDKDSPVDYLAIFEYTITTKGVTDLDILAQLNKVPKRVNAIITLMLEKKELGTEALAIWTRVISEFSEENPSENPAEMFLQEVEKMSPFECTRESVLST